MEFDCYNAQLLLGSFSLFNYNNYLETLRKCGVKPMMEKLNLKKSKFGIKRYNLRCPYCRTDHYVLYLWLRFKFLIHGEMNWHFHCPKCHKTTTKKMMFNIVNDHTDKEERLINGSKLWDNRIRR